MDFRKDINGLRAYAVIAVILFHYSNGILSGGFVGVDVFFVISGYLMTKIIFSKIDKDSFSLTSFYASRAKRIIPALSATCLLIFIAGYLFLSPKDYLALTFDALSSILFISNFWYAFNSGYFDESSLENPLLHTWSLSVEWQFYMIYPIAVMLLCRMVGKDRTIFLLYFALFLSFVAGVYFTYISATYAYYMFPSRAWEMILGGVCYFYETKSKNKFNKSMVEIAGFALIFYSVFAIDKNTPWPGHTSIIPTLGAFLVLIANNQKSIFTSGVIQQFIGKISYSIYLVHWPLLVLSWKIGINIDLLSYLCLTLVISTAVHYLFERDKGINVRNVAIYISCVVVGAIVYVNNGFALRVPDEFRLTKEEFHKKYFGGAGFPVSKDYYQNSNTRNFKYIFAGDSFAAQYAMAIKDSGVQAAGVYSYGCPLFPDYTRNMDNKEYKPCSFSFEVLETLFSLNKKASLIYTISWDTYHDTMIKKGGNGDAIDNKKEYERIITEQIKRIIAIGGNDRSYYFIGRPMVASFSGFDCLSGKSLIGYKFLNSCKTTQKEKTPEINKLVKNAIKGYDNAHFIDPNDYLCHGGVCDVIIDGKPVYSDQSHLSVYGAEVVFKNILKIIN
ncbi:acyltransferase family protein [Citrobacter amalonaticus]|nr:acyltransferase [Citrobacter amalonaticus]